MMAIGIYNLICEEECLDNRELCLLRLMIRKYSVLHNSLLTFLLAWMHRIHPLNHPEGWEVIL